MYKKDFDTWNVLKKEIDQKDIKIVHEGEIWWASLGLNIGDEQDGKNEAFERPVLVIRKFNNSIVWAVPLTSKSKTGIFYYTFEYEGESYSCILSQIKLMSTKRLSRFIRKIGTGMFFEIIEKIQALFPIDTRK